MMLNSYTDMANDNSCDVVQDYEFSDSVECEKSLVGKVKLHVSGLINSSISKWFASPKKENCTSSRKRPEDDKDYGSLQPPTKRPKLPSGKDILEGNHVTKKDSIELITHHNISTIDGKIGELDYNVEPEPGPSKIKPQELISTTEDSSKSINDLSATQTMAIPIEEQYHSSYSSMICDRNFSNLTGRKPYRVKSIFSTSAVTAAESCSPSMEMNMGISVTPSSGLKRTFNSSEIRTPDVEKNVATQQVMKSPFYRGRTIYGGGSTSRNRLGTAPCIVTNSLKELVRIKPTNNKNPSENATLSKTAQRILNTLEQYTTPIKNINNPNNRSPSKSLYYSKYISLKPYTLHEQKPLTDKQLEVFVTSDLLRMKEKLQTSTVSVKKIADGSKSSLNNDAYVLSTSNEGKSIHYNKLKARISRIRPKVQSESFAETLPLQPVTLPIENLPIFDLTVPLTAEPDNKKIYKTSYKMHDISEIRHSACAKQVSDGHILQESENLLKYTFSKPVVIAENLSYIRAINNFKFSAPLFQSLEVNSETNGNCISENTIIGKGNGEIKSKAQEKTSGSILDNSKRNSYVSTPFTKLSYICSTCFTPSNLEKNTCEVCGSLNTTKQSCLKCLQTGAFKCVCNSTSDLIATLQPSTAAWRCPTCMIENNDALDLCAACETLKPKKSSKPLSFKPPSKTWECSTCLVRNKNEDAKCVCCETLKPVNHATSNTIEKLDKSPSTWECSNCLKSYTDGNMRCVACEALKTINGEPKKISNSGIVLCNDMSVSSASTHQTKPELKAFEEKKSIESKNSNIWEKFMLKPANTWECPTCLITNSDKNTACLACETKKPLCESSFSKSNVEKKQEWECQSCLVKNPLTEPKCRCCETYQPGTSKVYDKNIIENSFHFGISNIPGGQTKSAAQTADIKNATNNTSSFIFGASGNVICNSPTKLAPSSARFIFGSNQEPVKPTLDIATSHNSANMLDKKSDSSTCFQPLQDCQTVCSANDFNQNTTLGSGTSCAPQLAKSHSIGNETNTPTTHWKPVVAKEDSITLSLPIKNSDVKTNVIVNDFCSDNTLISANLNPHKLESNIIPNLIFGERPKTVPVTLISSGSTTTQTKADMSTFSPIQKSTNPLAKFSATPASRGLSCAKEANLNSITDPSYIQRDTSCSAIAALPNVAKFDFSNVTVDTTSQKPSCSFGVQAQLSTQNFIATSITHVPVCSSGGFNLDPNTKPSYNFTGSTSIQSFTAQPVTEGVMGSTQRRIKRAIRRTTQR